MSFSNQAQDRVRSIAVDKVPSIPLDKMPSIEQEAKSESVPQLKHPMSAIDVIRKYVSNEADSGSAAGFDPVGEPTIRSYTRMPRHPEPKSPLAKYRRVGNSLSLSSPLTRDSGIFSTDDSSEEEEPPFESRMHGLSTPRGSPAYFGDIHTSQELDRSLNLLRRYKSRSTRRCPPLQLVGRISRQCSRSRILGGNSPLPSLNRLPPLPPLLLMPSARSARCPEPNHMRNSSDVKAAPTPDCPTQTSSKQSIILKETFVENCTQKTEYRREVLHQVEVLPITDQMPTTHQFGSEMYKQ